MHDFLIILAWIVGAAIAYFFFVGVLRLLRHWVGGPGYRITIYAAGDEIFICDYQEGDHHVFVYLRPALVDEQSALCADLSDLQRWEEPFQSELIASAKRDEIIVRIQRYLKDETLIWMMEEADYEAELRLSSLPTQPKPPPDPLAHTFYYFRYSCAVIIFIALLMLAVYLLAISTQ